MSDSRGPSNPEPALTRGHRAITLAAILPLVVVIVGLAGGVVFKDVSALRFLFFAAWSVAMFSLMMQRRPWRRQLLDEARFQGDYLWMRRRKDVLVVPLRYIESVAIEGGFLSFRYIRLILCGPCSFGSIIALLPKSWPGDSYDRCVVAEQLEERVRRASLPVPQKAAP
jgi:hypothetical protein